MTVVLKAELSQIFTPEPTARIMAAMLLCPEPHLRLLDAGAGIGNLTQAAVKMLCRRSPQNRPNSLQVIAYEIDQDLIEPLRQTLNCCRKDCAEAGIKFSAEIICRDFLEAASEQLTEGLFSVGGTFNCAILNPPYRKIQSASSHRRWLRRMGIETSNLYTGFLAAAIRLLEPRGEIVAITPRSFCSGSYFRSFRCDLLSKTALDRLHLFESREETFRDAEVLQETLIFHAVKDAPPPEFVIVTGTNTASTGRRVPFDEVVAPGDQNAFIHVVPHQEVHSAAGYIGALPCCLDDLGLSVSTGRVVDFRVRAFLRVEHEPGTVPLLYPGHLSAGSVIWPRSKGVKPSHIIAAKETESLLVPNGNYVLLRRFSTKEEKKRLVATVFEAGCVPGDQVGFENHLNYFHCRGADLDLTLARGLAAFLNSTLADSYFRQFNGHTQVNAIDLRSFRYPSAAQMQSIGQKTGPHWEQSTIDGVLESIINAATD